MAARNQQATNGGAAPQASTRGPRDIEEDEEDHASDKGKEEEEGTAKKAVQELKRKFVPGLKYSLLLMVAIDFGLLVVGCLNVHKCPVNPNIPFFLIVTGGIGVFVKFLTYVRDRIVKRIKLKYIESSLYFIETVFFFTGTYWTYSEFKPDFDHPGSRFHCNKTAYMFAFVYLTMVYTLLIGMIAFVCCFIICFCALASGSPTVDPESQIPYIDQTPSAEERRNETQNL